MSPELGESASDQQNKLSEEEDKEYKVKYRDLKRTLKNVVSKNEYLKSELRHSQKKLQVTKDLKQKLLNFLKSSNRISFFVATTFFNLCTLPLLSLTLNVVALM